ncbi:hypothetical protein ACA910_007408 [Epithemia clementina (nom. ined.)]
MTLTTHAAFAQRLVDAVQANATLAAALQQDNGGVEFTLHNALATGYWTLTRYLIRQVAQQAQERNHYLLLTGHSQGGTRAQLASMYLHQQAEASSSAAAAAASSSSTTSSSNTTTSTTTSSSSSFPTSQVVKHHSTVTFGASGSSCMARQLWYQSNAELLSSVNPFVPQNQLTEYVHPLDPWGNALLGRDNGGHVCFWGSTNAVRQQEAEAEQKAAQTAEEEEENSDGDGGYDFGTDDDDDDDDYDDDDTTIPVIDPAYIYCSRVYGYRAPLLLAAANHAPLGHLALNEPKIRQDLERCRYYTHSIEATVLALSLGETLRVVLPQGENDNVTSSSSSSSTTTTTTTMLLLQPDGTTDGGCHSVLVIPQDDPMQSCPAVGDSGMSQSEKILATEIIIGMVVGSLLCLCCTYQVFCVWFCYRRRRRRAKQGGRGGLQRVQQYKDKEDGYRDNDDVDHYRVEPNHGSAILAAARSGDDQDEVDALWNQRSSSGRSNPEYDSI